jgi:hypothetical protein
VKQGTRLMLFIQGDSEPLPTTFRYDISPSKLTGRDIAEDSDVEMREAHSSSDDSSEFSADEESSSSSGEESITSSEELYHRTSPFSTVAAPAENSSVSTKDGNTKIKIDSSVRVALASNDAPLLAFFKKCTPEEHRVNLVRDQERMAIEAEDVEKKEKVIKEKELNRKHEVSRLRQRCHREKIRAQEILNGQRSPGGHKRKLRALELVDPQLTKKHRLNLPEETRPARLLQRKIKDKNRKPQGRKEKGKPRPAKYHNWFTPISWRLIDQAAKVVGWRMSPSDIVRIAKARNPEIFEGLTRETVKNWIDKTGVKPQWSDSTMLKISAANTPGHANGGPCGIFVSNSHANQ